MYNLTPEQVSALLQAHCSRVLGAMSHEDLLSYAHGLMTSTFDKDPGCGNTDLPLLLQDIAIAEDQDLESVSEFIAGELGNEASEYIMNHHQF